jgi:novobiocin biosynthesis protein NovU/D-mycarose 3-C-methyltransferase
VAIPIPGCRICEAGALEPVLSLGDLPPVNSFLAGPADIAAERRHPLAIAFCAACSHVQLTHRLDPRDVFTDYIYFSSMSDTVLRWGVTLAERYGRELGLAPGDLVAELASNDGAILRAFRGRARLVGIEPARNIAEVANREGIPTRAEFFDARRAASLRAELGPAKLVIARNVVAHVPEVIDFVAGAAAWLADDGVFHVEVPYVRDMVEALEFDTIYHEHLSYFSVTALDRLFREAGLVLWDVERIPMHGGSLVARGRRTGPPTADVARFLAAERNAGFAGVAPYRRFAEGTRRLRERVRPFVEDLHHGGRRVAAYGAAAKGVVLTNYCGIGPDLVDWVADRSPYKQGKLMPGTHLPVVGPERVLAERPDFLLVLAWNLFDEIAEQQAAYRRAGGTFVVPVPEPTIR